jgi:hypothetical protein
MNAPIEEPLRITGPHFLDEHNITQIPTTEGHMTLVVCAARAKINPKSLYFRLVRLADAWSRDDVLARRQSKAGGGYRGDVDLMKAACRNLAPRREIESIKVGSWERRQCA